MRPGADPAVLARVMQEERMNAQSQPNPQGNAPQQFLMGLGRALPKVSMDLIAPPAEQVAKAAAAVQGDDGGAKVESANSQASSQSASQSAYLANYGASSVPPPPPGAFAGGLVPPPVPVTLSTQAQAYSGSVGDANYNPYANPYLNPYGIPVQQMQPVAQTRPAGLFGNASNASATSDSVEAKKKNVAFTPITPKGMESRSPFKQRDDLNILWKGAISQSVNLGSLADDQRVLGDLSRVQVGLPNEATKGNFNISSRQLQSVFKTGNIDRRIIADVHKLETELAQSYYRYLYTYNKYCFTQQSLAARKQEVELADSPSEQQRAAADLASAQTEVDSAKDDMRSAQIELAQASSPTAARSVIAKVSGIAPNLDSLILREAKDNNRASHRIAMFSNLFNPIESVLKFAHQKRAPNQEEASAGDADGASYADSDNDSSSSAKANKANKVNKTTSVSRKTDKIAIAKDVKPKLKVVKPDDGPDLAPAPKEEVVDNAESDADTKATPKASAASAHEAANVSFTLKGVNVTSRKSVLSVAIKNAGADTFNFSPDLISVAEGNRKLSDAATRADFDTTLVGPNEEVKGTITIFGRPWSDKLTVALVDGSKAIQMRR